MGERLPGGFTIGFDDEWFESRQVKFEPATDLEKLFHEKGFKHIKIGNGKRNHNPTDAGHCIRKRVLEFMGAPESNPSSFGGNMVFSMGDKLGQVLAEVAMQARVYVDAESNIFFWDGGLEYPFSGRMDVAIEDPFFETHMGIKLEGQDIIPVEYKTIKSNGFDDDEGIGKNGKPWKSLGARSQPKKDHIMQLHHYLRALNAPYGYIFYLNKNDQRTAVHRVYWNAKVWQDVIDEATVVEAYVNAGLVPVRGDLHRGAINFYARGNPATGATKGDINWNEAKFPCGYKGKDGGEPGWCKLVHVCWRKEIMEQGSEKEKAHAMRFAAFEFTEGRLNVDLAQLRQDAEDTAADDTDPATTAPKPARAET